MYISLIGIKIQNQKEVHPSVHNFDNSSCCAQRPDGTYGDSGELSHSLLADSLTLFQSQGADYPHCKGLSPLFKKCSTWPGRN